MYGKWLYKEIGTEYGACMVEIYRKNYTGESIEIGALAAGSLSIALENLGSITDPIGKSVCSFSIIDTNQVEYDDFFTPDATALKVVVSTRIGSGAYVARWSGYVTPDFFAENLSYRTPISISARDNIGYLNDVDFDLTATTITVRELIQSAFTRIAEDYPMSLSFVTQKQTAEGILAIDAIISTTLLREMSWGEALETILHDLGLQMRWADNNTIAVLDLSQIPEYYATQSFNFIGASGYREIVPAWRQLSQEQDYGLKENFFEGKITSQNVKFIKEEKVDYYLPGIMDGSPRNVIFKYYKPTDWISQGEIYTLNPADYSHDGFFQDHSNNLFKNKIYFTGIAADFTDYANHYMGWRQPVYKSNWPLSISFKAFNAVMYTDSWIVNNLYPITLYSSSSDRYQIGLKANVLLHTETATYILRQDWALLTGAEEDAITFILPDIKANDVEKEEEVTISINQIPYDGQLELRIYGFFKNPEYDSNVNVSNDSFVKMVTYIKDVIYTYESSSIPTGQDSGVLVNEQHNIKDDQDYTFGQVPNDCGGINAFVGGLYKANGDELIGFQRNVDATNYNLLELVGREIIHFNKRNYNRLSGTIRNLDKEPLMFNRLFVREGKKYAPYNYSLNVISNEMNITSMQEVEPYTTANFTEVNSEITTGGSTVSSGNNQILQYSAEVGNAKRLYELQTISENEKPDAYVLVDGAGYPEARKLKLTDIAGLDEKALEQYLVQYKYLQEVDLQPIIQDFEKLEEAVNPLFGYFDATGNANNALRLGGHSADYFAPAKAVNTLTTDLNSLVSRVSINEQGIATNKTNIATLVGQVNGLANDVETLKGYWYIDDDGSLHTTYNIVVDGGGAFGKGSGGGGDVPSGGGIDEAQLWNILGASGTQTIHSSHIPDLSNKYLGVSGGTMTGNLVMGSYSSVFANMFLYGVDEGLSLYSDKSGSVYTLIHSGNIGSYNAGSATKLQTARTIWGQSFDGTGDVSGMLSGVNAIFFEPTKTYGIQRGSYYSASLTVDDIAIYAKKTILGGAGSVLIGTTTDSGYKLDVNGDLRVTGNAVFDGAISTSGNIINIGGSSSEQAINFIKNGVYRNQLDAYNDSFIIYSYRSSGKWGQDLIVYRETGNVEIPNNLVIGKASNTNWREITFNRSGSAGFIGHGSGMEMGFLDGYIQVKKDVLRFVNNSVAQTIYHSGNFNPADYLPLSGGTLTGDIRTKSYASGTDGLGLYIEGYSNLGLRIQYNKSTTGSDYDQILLKDGVLKFNSKEVIHTGNYSTTTDNRYLQLSGGTVSGDYGALNIKRNSTASSLVAFSNTNGLLGYLGMESANKPAYWTTSIDRVFLIHENNIKDYNAGSATKLQTARTIWGQLFDGRADVGGALFGATYIRANEASVNGIYLKASLYTNVLGESDIAIVTPKLAVLNGNILIGTTEDYGYKLYVAGNARVSKEFRCNINYITVSGNDIGWFGAPNDTSTTDYVCALTSGNIRFNTAGKERLKITNGGNILISNSNLTVGDANTISYVMLNRGASRDGGILFQEGSANRWQVVDLSDKSLAFYNYNVGKHTFKLGSTGVLTNTNYIRIQTNDWAAFEVDRGTAGISSIGGMDSSGVYFAHTKDGTTTYMYLKAGSGLSIHSNLTVTGGGAFGSDIRYKDITSYRQLDLETIVNAPLFTFRWTDREDKVEHLGTSAQYWLGTQFKDAVNITNPKFYHLDYGALAVGIGISVAREVKGVKTEVEVLRERVNQLEKELAQCRRA